MLLKGAPVVKQLKDETKKYIDQHKLAGKYVAFLLLSHAASSKVYVNLKTDYAQEVGLGSEVIKDEGQSHEDVMRRIEQLNNDDDCIGIVVQLPLVERLVWKQTAILRSIVATKDLDGLTGKLFGDALVGATDFMPATPKAVLALLHHYGLDSFKGKTVSIFGQSNLIGKPLAISCMKREATVYSFNEHSSRQAMKEAARVSDYVISATGELEMIDDTFLGEKAPKQILVDVGRGTKNGKPVGDMQWKKLQQLVHAITPVPGGVGPVTVASLFHNITILNELDT